MSLVKFWNKRNKIEFFHNEPSIIENFPIIESKNLKLKWVKKVKQDFANHVKNKTDYAHLSRCPGIFDLFKYGYVISLHKDIIINFSGKEFEWKFASGSLEQPFEHFLISGFDESTIDLLVKPPWSADFIIKIDTGWHIIAPKGVNFIMLPIAYPDTFDFTSAIGIFNPAVSTNVNFQMYWNGKEKENTIIKAGTPLGHLIPLSEKKYQMVQRNMNQRDRRWVEKMASAYNSTFWNHTMRKKIVDMYNKYWKR